MISLNQTAYSPLRNIYRANNSSITPNLSMLNKDIVSFREQPEYIIRALFDAFIKGDVLEKKIKTKFEGMPLEDLQQFLNFAKSKIDKTTSEIFADTIYSRLMDLKTHFENQNLTQSQMVSNTIKQIENL